MQSEVRYCTTEDGVRIAYSVEGEGPPLLFCHHIPSFSLTHIVPSFDEAIRRIGRGRCFIRYDWRGTGLSQQGVDDFSLAALLLDVEAVVRAVGFEQIAVLGVGPGGPTAIGFAARHPDRVASLILYATCARLPDVYPPHVLRALAGLARSNWDLASRALADTGTRRDLGNEGIRWAELIRRSVTGETMARILEANADVDVTGLLASIRCPVVVCHSLTDSEYPLDIGQRMAERIPNATLVPLDGGATGPFANAEATLDALDRYLPAPLRGAAPAWLEKSRVHLTRRETEVLRLVTGGLTSKEISRDLSLSIRTVGRHITNIYEKIGARSRAEATAYALRHHIAEE